MHRIRKLHSSQGGRGHWTVYYTSPQSIIITFSYSLALQHWGLLLNFDKIRKVNYNLPKLTIRP